MLLVGLGNPGEKYRFTRHNVGFMTVDAFAKRHAFLDFKLDKKSPVLLAGDFIEYQKVVLAKPQAFMNNSGLAVKSLYAKYKIPDTRYTIIVHDDIDLPFGHMKISVGSGSGGHKGVESIIQELGTQDFGRIRVGIQPDDGKPARVEEFVLQQFSQAERAALQETIENACSALDTILREGIETAMNEYNK